MPSRSLHPSMLSNKAALSTQPNKQNAMVSEKKKKINTIKQQYNKKKCHWRCHLLCPHKQERYCLPNLWPASAVYHSSSQQRTFARNILAHICNEIWKGIWRRLQTQINCLQVLDLLISHYHPFPMDGQNRHHTTYTGSINSTTELITTFFHQWEGKGLYSEIYATCFLNPEVSHFLQCSLIFTNFKASLNHCLKHVNHRMVLVGRDSKDSCPPAMGRELIYISWDKCYHPKLDKTRRYKFRCLIFHGNTYLW